MQVEALAIDDVKRIKPKRLRDERGYFTEIFKSEWFKKTVSDVVFVQENESLSKQAGTVRGLHFQLFPFPQGKLVRCTQGAFLDVAVDIRTGSPTFGHWVSQELSAENGEQLWIPPGFAHGFMTLTADTVIHYKVTARYSAEHDRGLKWNDPAIGIQWPEMDRYFLSEKDARQPPLSELHACFEY